MGLLRGPALLLGVAACLLGSFLGYSSHSPHYFSTSVSEPGQDSKLPEMTKVDGGNPQYWDQNIQNSEQRSQADLFNEPKYYSQSGDPCMPLSDWSDGMTPCGKRMRTRQRMLKSAAELGNCNKELEQTNQTTNQGSHGPESARSVQSC